jgi:hypothetical protein
MTGCGNSEDESLSNIYSTLYHLTESLAVDEVSVNYMERIGFHRIYQESEKHLD